MVDRERQFEDFVSNIKFDDTPDPSHRDKLEQDLLTALAKQSRQIKLWRIIMKSRITKLAAAAVIIIVIMFGINYLDAPIDGASTVFAAAMNSVRQARTFSCTEITERPNRDGDGQEGEKFLFRNKWMFKEPDWERHERPRGPWGKVVNEITVTHYGKRQRLELKSVEKTARLHDMSSNYGVDDKTGELRLIRLSTDLRDRLLKTSAGAVDDLGEAVLEGKPVRILQSRKGKRITTVWIDPKTKHPVQIEHKWAGQSRSPLMYASIEIDADMDDDLFSLKPPEGYTVKVSKALYADERMKMVAKIMHMGKLCLIYWSNHNNVFPNELADIVTAGIMSDDALRNVLAAPDEPNRPPVIRYRRPDYNVPDRGIEVMLYEVHEEGSGDGRVMVLMLTPHAELMPVQTLTQFLKPWPEHQKKLSSQMTRLHWFCDRYAKEHGGKYPVKLADITGAEVWEDTIKRLQAPWGQPDGPAVIRYRPLRADTEPSTEVILHEIYDQWPEDGVVACFADGHCERILDQNRFEELIK